ncbi:MAG: transglutaminase domain-containing protein [Candidatus Omnitrophica bacterium]|nr:transglutaminase domain-containing protein [Candidatus Omnitrophota bacterium]
MRSLRWMGIVIFAGVVELGFGVHSTGSINVESPREREGLFTYRVRITQPLQRAGTIDVWIPLAKTTREQQILRRQIHAPVPYTIAQDPEYGNDILHLSLQPPLPEGFEVAIDYQTHLGLGEGAAIDLPAPADELARELTSHGLVIVDDEVRTRALHATAGRRTPMDRARGIYEAVIRQVKYDKSLPGWGRGDTRRVCLLGMGNCTDFHSLFISMARASGIPARFKVGVVIPRAPSKVIPGYHCWAEFYLEERGWVPVDASEAWKHPELVDYYFGAHDPNRLLLSVGRDIQLVPRQHGEPVNIFFYPYVEANGQVVDGVETQLMFREFNREEGA